MLRNFLLLAGIILALASCKNQEKEASDPAVEEAQQTVEQTEEVEVKMVNMRLEPKSGSSAVGRIKFREENGTVYMEMAVKGLEPGTHAVHIHEKADCSADDGTSSGGHWNPTFEPHGAWGDEAGFHRGDIGNFEADENGQAVFSFSTDLWCLGCDDESKNILGKAIIVHAGEDDLTSQPSGAAGARVSCGGIIE